MTILPIININWWLQIPENAEWGKMAFPGQDFGNAPVGWAVRYGDQEWKDFLDMYSGWVAANDLSKHVLRRVHGKDEPIRQEVADPHVSASSGRRGARRAGWRSGRR